MRSIQARRAGDVSQTIDIGAVDRLKEEYGDATGDTPSVAFTETPSPVRVGSDPALVGPETGAPT
jgi:hypothetical protein